MTRPVTTHRQHPLIAALNDFCDQHGLVGAVLLIPRPERGTIQMVAAGHPPHAAAMEGLGSDLMAAIARGDFDSTALVSLEGGSVQ
ncbi:hypothetical protein [Nitrospirillum amazonense]|uniref:hypothetical protein n=1 Tax=Nitrospirillum amazonense TaxID=28077 RepID=UPI002412175A|nr:hypothetical protein [Nitrospirillum amazonense]MDG3444511.1 hypothetical protein [Nitrospirillum amazonense]